MLFRSDAFLARQRRDGWEHVRGVLPQRLPEEVWHKALKKADDDREAALDVLLNPRGTQPGHNFERVLAPLIPYAVKGVCWYQGESNAWGFPVAEQYRAELKLLISHWRRRWRRPALPFLVVQLPHYPGKPSPRPHQLGPWHVVMEAQWRIQDELPRVWTAVTVDLGQEGNIHPHRKRPVGERLAALARNRVYGREAVACYGPTLDRAAFEGDRVRLHFDHVHGGLVAKGDTLQGFTIAGEDRHFVWADAEIDGGTIVCRSPKVPAPTAVRYAMAEGCLFNLYNEAGLPAPPFRTDDWTVDLHPETPRRATAARAPAAPVIDGDLDEPAWEGAQPLTAFTLLHTRRPAAHPTEAHVVWDDQHLYVGLRCRQDPGQLRAEAETTDDKRIWQDDNVQVFLDVTADKTTYVRYAVNPAGVVAHGYGSNDTGPDNRFLALGILPHFRHFSTAWDSEIGRAHV